MSTVNVGSISAGLGLDLTEFQNGMKRATELSRSSTTLMSAEMKRSSREGAESLRLIDEALGIRISRPLTRILTQEFPSFAKGLQTILGGAVVGALAVVAIETFDKVSKAIEKAQKAQEEYAASTRKAHDVFAEAMAGFAKDERLGGLSGMSKKLAEIDTTGIENARKRIDELTEALIKNAKAAVEAHSWWTQLLAGTGDVGHKLFSFRSTLDVEAINKQLEGFKEQFDELSRIDITKGSREGAQALEGRILAAQADLDAMQQTKTSGLADFAFPGPFQQTGFSEKAIDAQKQLIAGLKQMSALQSANDQATAAAKSAAAHTANAEALKKEVAAAQAAAEGQEKLAERLEKIHTAAMPAKDGLAQIDDELHKNELSLLSLNAAIGPAAFFVKFHESVGKVIQDLRDFAAAQESTIKLNELLKKDRTDALPSFTPRTPTLGSGGTVAGQVENFSRDQAAQTELVKKALQDALTPTQQEKLATEELNIAFGNLDAKLKQSPEVIAAYKAALNQISEQATKSELSLRKLENEMQKLLEHSTSAGDGMKAFIKSIEIEAAQKGKFTFDILNQGLKGFEDNMVSTITTGRANWGQFFTELESMALKFALNSLLAKMFSSLSNPPTGSGGGGSDSPWASLIHHAAGGDVTPGQGYLVGEEGPEPFFPSTSGTIMPNSALKKSGGDTHYYDLRGAVVTDDLMRKADAAKAISMSQQRMMQAIPGMVNEINLRKRSS